MLHYKTFENNKFDSWIVMIHGAGGSIEVWFRQVADYALHFNLLLVDLAGHGGSANESFGKGFNFSRAAEQVMEVVNHLNIKKGHFIGLSLGSIVVRIIAKHNPQQVSSMVLAGAVTQLNTKVRTLLTLATTFKRLIPYSLIKSVIAKCIIPQGKYENSKRLFLNNAKKVSFDSFHNWLKLGDGVSTYIKELFEEYIAIPTLYMMGEDDRLFLPQVRQTVRNAGDYVSLIVVPNAGHVCNVDNKRYFNHHSLEFMRVNDDVTFI
ncbi:MAG: alpha/beta hydrolase [Bacteroidales bacterium]|nr:alpha/beta hydrolase [Bacteroidales bacterium]